MEEVVVVAKSVLPQQEEGRAKVIVAMNWHAWIPSTPST
jgi:hypothetical protein